MKPGDKVLVTTTNLLTSIKTGKVYSKSIKIEGRLLSVGPNCKVNIGSHHITVPSSSLELAPVGNWTSLNKGEK